ncbi:MAG: ice-binding family protein [Bacteroidota bacterium]
MKNRTENPGTVSSRGKHFLGVMLMLALMAHAVAISQGTAPPLGTSANFGILARAAITGTATITGNVGTLSGPISGTITAAPGYTVYPVNDGVVQTAITDLNAAYLNAAGQTGDSTLAGGILTGVLSPGVYILSAATPNLIDSVTLDGGGDANAVFVFQASSTLITGDGSSVILTGGTQWINVFWQVTSSATLAANSAFEGTVLANTTITLGAGATVYGRLLGGAVTTTGAVTANSDVLPVQLTSFVAMANRMSAELHWSTATEVNNYGFEVERRSVTSSGLRVAGSNQHETLNTQHATEWVTIGFVPGSGTSTSPRDYSYTDKNLSPGRYAYRMKQVDMSGAFSYHGSAEVEIGLTAKKFELESNYPNPFNPTTTIQFTLADDGLASLRVYNMLGQTVMTLFDGIAEAGKLYQMTFDASRLPSGLYFARLESGRQQMMRTMVLMK